MSEPRKHHYIPQSYQRGFVIVLLVNWALWLFGLLPTPIALVFGGACGILTLIGIIGHIAGSNSQRVVTLGSLTAGPGAPVRRKASPRTNLTLLGIRHGQFFIDEKHGFWEINVPKTKDPLYCAVLLFGNAPMKMGKIDVTALTDGTIDVDANQAGQIIRNLRARLRYTGQHHEDIALIDRGTWVREEYNAINLGVGDARALIVAIGLSPDEAKDDHRFGSAIQNNHYTIDNFHEPTMWELGDYDTVGVHLQLVAGDGGYVMYEGTFNLQIYPHLVLTIKRDESS